MAIIHDIAITLFDRLGSKTVATLIELYGSAEVALTKSYDRLIEDGVSKAVALSMTNLETRQAAKSRASAILEKCQKNGIRILVHGQQYYPELLGQCPDAPHVLYVRGDLDFNFGKWISIVGTRKATRLGIDATELLVQDFAMSYSDGVVVSGLAFGVDKAAHQAALKFGIPTVAVMAGWVDDIVPSSHLNLAREILSSGGAVISDMPPETVIRGSNFLSRNRIIAGLSHLTLVAESAAKGGSLVTADIAVSYDRELFAMPGRSSDPQYAGTNLLIKSCKAQLYQDISDIAQAMNWTRGNRPVVHSTDLSAYQAALYNAMPDTAPTTLDEMSQALGLSLGETSSRMIQLEGLGFIKSLQGRLYQKTKY